MERPLTQSGHSSRGLIWVQTYRAVIKQVEQGNKESSPMLSVPSDHRVEVRAEGRVRVVVAKPSNHCAFGALDGVLHLVGHLQSCNSLHLKTPAQELCVST